MHYLITEGKSVQIFPFINVLILLTFLQSEPGYFVSRSPMHLQIMKLPDGQFFSPASMIFNRPLTTNNTQRTLPHIGPARVTYNLKIRLTY